MGNPSVTRPAEIQNQISGQMLLKEIKHGFFKIFHYSEFHVSLFHDHQVNAFILLKRTQINKFKVLKL